MIKDILNYFSLDSNQYFSYLSTHLLISTKSISIACLIGFPLGYLSYKHKILSHFFQTASQFLRIIPSLAVLFILIPIVGVGELPALIALSFLAIPSILINTSLGLHEVPVEMKDVARGIGMNPTQLFFKIEISLAMPYFLNGIKLAIVEVLASTTLAIYIGAGGLGTLIFTGLASYRIDLLIIGGASVTILSLGSISLFDFLIRKVSKNNV